MTRMLQFAIGTWLISSTLHAQPTEIAPVPSTDPQAQINLTQHAMDLDMPEVALDYSAVVYQVYELHIMAVVLLFGLILLVVLGARGLKKYAIDWGLLSYLSCMALGLALLVMRLKLG